MLKKENRLSRSSDFLKFKLAKSQTVGILTLKVIPQNIGQKFGIIVSNKVSAKATKRNQIRRRIRAIIRKDKPKLKNGLYLIIAKPAVLRASKKDLTVAMETLWRASGAGCTTNKLINR